MSVSRLLDKSEIVAECLTAWCEHPIFKRDFLKLTEGPAQMSPAAATEVLMLHVPRMALAAADGAQTMTLAVQRFITEAVLMDEMHEQYS